MKNGMHSKLWSVKFFEDRILSLKNSMVELRSLRVSVVGLQKFQLEQHEMHLEWNNNGYEPAMFPLNKGFP